MCGIAGFFGHRNVERPVWQAMLDALRRRGPDAAHAVLWSGALKRSEDEGRAGLLHARLSIRDPRPLADQPMGSADGNIWLCYNGEVYGWEEDAERLRALGYEFNTRSDTEFILHAYQEWGMDFLERLRGMFAIALLDLRAGKLLLIRDRMGLKPIVYYHALGEFAFASTVRAVLPYLPPARRRFSAAGIDAYLAHRYIPAPLTIFEDLRRLENGHYLCLDLADGSLTKQRYWQEEPAAKGDFLVILDEAVRLRTVADRPVGLFLSGGIDSACIASSLARQGYGNIVAYTAAFPGSAMDESTQAAQIAARLGLQHRVIAIAENLADDFERLVADFDEPFADPSAVPLWYLSRETSKEVKVVLSGDGGDELFAGYKRYAKHMRTRWRANVLLKTTQTINGVGSGRLTRWLEELRLSWAEAYSLRFSGMSPVLRRHLQPAGPVHSVYWRSMPVENRSLLHSLLSIDMDNYLPEYILRKGDLCTMAFGLELRAPLLDHEFYRHVLAMPDRQRFTRPAKLALKIACPPCQALGLFQQKKRGFNPPLRNWLLRDLAERLPQLGARLQSLSCGQLDGVRVQNLVEHYRQEDAGLAEQVLQLLILDESLRQLT